MIDNRSYKLVVKLKPKKNSGLMSRVMIPLKRVFRPVPNAAPLMCRTKLNTVRLWSDFGATA